MTYETKVVLSAIAHVVAKSETLEEAYYAVKEMANVEGLVLETYEEKRKTIQAINEKDRESTGKG